MCASVLFNWYMRVSVREINHIGVVQHYRLS